MPPRSPAPAALLALALTLTGCDRVLENDPEVDEARLVIEALRGQRLPTAIEKCRADVVATARAELAARGTPVALTARPAGGTIVCTSTDATGQPVTARATCADVPAKELTRLALTPLHESACDAPPVELAPPPPRLKRSEKQAWLRRTREAIDQVERWLEAPLREEIRAHLIETCAPEGCVSRMIWTDKDGQREAAAEGTGPTRADARARLFEAIP